MGCKVRPLQVRYMKVTQACRLPPLDENACSYGRWLRVHGVPWTKMQLTDKRLSFSWARSAHARWQISKSRPNYRLRTARSFLTRPRIIDGRKPGGCIVMRWVDFVELNTVRMFGA